ncbi:hypothetical protein [Amycolatopsis samaneae]|uniref:Secreted protein n=1 Tax=Amycolatopsis samaneae TaxID=664691 RepID=A0ABW5GL55_9PSEU
MTRNRFAQSITVKRAAATLAAGAALVSGTALAFAGSASAAPAGHQTQVCAKGDYAAYAVFPERGGLSTAVVDAGKCMPFDLGNRDVIETVEVWGFLPAKTPNDAPTTFPVATGKVHDSKGGTIAATGTVEHPDAQFPLL